MHDLVALAHEVGEKTERVQEYYESYFASYSENDLFEVYDVEREEFVQFAGRQGSQVINLNTLIKNLVEMELYNESVEPYIILEYNRKTTDFSYPVFIGGKHGYKEPA